MLKLKLQYFGHLMWRADSSEKTLMWGKIEGRRRRGQQRIYGWMASPTQWTWVWVNSASWWWTGRPSVLQSMGSQRVRRDWVTELNWTEEATPHPFKFCHDITATQSYHQALFLTLVLWQFSPPLQLLFLLKSWTLSSHLWGLESTSSKLLLTFCPHCRQILYNLCICISSLIPAEVQKALYRWLLKEATQKSR